MHLEMPFLFLSEVSTLIQPRTRSLQWLQAQSEFSYSLPNPRFHFHKNTYYFGFESFAP
ncbi:hypothetical protein Pan216_55570 [Planctomycetes bacterium Pan216]|uniref:Uncharacterized protein n=1 Tax=Kolteria novifilia TaxID=2527975 RepID=A0A518BCF8_9BACT|nr:hypothetical protein Pan216_55570 [Planctomycetes bacterium Pan216]